MYKIPMTLSALSLWIGIREYPNSNTNSITSEKGILLGMEDISILGVMICTTSVFPSLTIPSNNFCSSDDELSSVVMAMACSNSSEEIRTCFPPILPIKFVPLTNRDFNQEMGGVLRITSIGKAMNRVTFDALFAP